MHSHSMIRYHHRHFFLTSSNFFSNNNLSKPFAGIWALRGEDKRDTNYIRLNCSPKQRKLYQENTREVQSGTPTMKLEEIVDHDYGIEERKAPNNKVSYKSKKVEEYVETIKSMFGWMEDGEISISAYDTAWVALVQDVNGSGSPQFPSSLEWIANNQLPDGSWGDPLVFTAHDRLLNTLACVIALKSWDIHSDKCDKGLLFFEENMSKLKNENEEHIPIGFEVAFPSLLEVARSLNIKIPYDSPVFQNIYAKRDLKFSRIPLDIMHNVPTTLLHSMEGMPNLDWEKLQKLKCENGSFMFSPSSTAFAVMQTKDANCLRYLKNVVQRFNGGVPNVYPVDMFEHLWVVDRLQRLGISRYFQLEIKECLDYVYRYWDNKDGICWARNSPVQDVDDTAMGFRLLRLYGYDVSPDVFRQFENNGEFVCFAGQYSQAVTGMFNLYRASHLLFPGEKILENANRFSSGFLRERRAADQLSDKWIIAKDLSGEVEFALKTPWYTSLPRLETRFYIEQYGGDDDVWIGKTLYRMPYVNNNVYLEFAKLDYNNCQALHVQEWNNMQKWYYEMNFGDFGVSRTLLLLAYFLAAASVFEPERSKERLAWAKTLFLVETIESYLHYEENFGEQRKAFAQMFRNVIDTRISNINGRKQLDTNKKTEKLIDTIFQTLDQLSTKAQLAHGRDLSSNLHSAWGKWMLTWLDEGDGKQAVAELVVQTIILSSGRSSLKELLSHPQYTQLSNLTNRVCHQLYHCQKHKVDGNGCYDKADKGNSTTTHKIESNMQELVQLVLQNSSNDIDSYIRQTFLTVARSFYYMAHCDMETIVFHIGKVLFEKVRT